MQGFRFVVARLRTEIGPSRLWAAESERDAAQQEQSHRVFVVAALSVTLTLGAAWGAYLLYRISCEGAFQAVTPAAVIAHGSAQL